PRIHGSASWWGIHWEPARTSATSTIGGRTASLRAWSSVGRDGYRHTVPEWGRFGPASVHFQHTHTSGSKGADEIPFEPQVMDAAWIRKADPRQVAQAGYVADERPADHGVIVEPALDVETVWHRNQAIGSCLHLSAVADALAVWRQRKSQR